MFAIIFAFIFFTTAACSPMSRPAFSALRMAIVGSVVRGTHVLLALSGLILLFLFSRVL